TRDRERTRQRAAVGRWTTTAIDRPAVLVSSQAHGPGLAAAERGPALLVLGQHRAGLEPQLEVEWVERFGLGPRQLEGRVGLVDADREQQIDLGTDVADRDRQGLAAGQDPAGIGDAARQQN